MESLRGEGVKEPTADERDALARLVAQGGSVRICAFDGMEDLERVRSSTLYGVPIGSLLDKGLVMFSSFMVNITITSLGRALAKERA